MPISPSSTEQHYLDVMSSSSVVRAYRDWDAVSDTESQFLAATVERNSRVLELGCGAGRFSRFLEGGCGSYVGVDISHEMLCAARERQPDGVFIRCDVSELQIAPNAFDVVLFMHNGLDALHPVSRRTELLSKVADWLPRQGRFVFSTHLLPIGDHRPSGHFAERYHGMTVSVFRTTLARCAAELESAGLTPVRADTVFVGQQPVWAYFAAQKQA